MDFRVSVIIPVFNAQPYLQQAVESALAQPEAEEILIVEDGSSDGSLALALDLAAREGRVRVLQHPDQANRGAGASRNLGILQSRQPYLAFLDADDFFLPNRFAEARGLLEEEPSAEGTYEAVGAIFEDKQTERRWHEHWQGHRVTRLTRAIKPEYLFEALLRGGYGYFHLDGLTIYRDSIRQSGPFNEALRLHQDTEFCIRLAAVARLIPGSQRPVAIRRFHSRSRILAAREKPDEGSTSMMYDHLLAWAEKNLSQRRLNLIREAALLADLRAPGSRLGWPRRTWRLFSVLFDNPSLARNLSYWKLHFRGVGRLRDFLLKVFDSNSQRPV